MTFRTILSAAAAAALTAGAAQAQQTAPEAAEAEVMDRNGTSIGTVFVQQAPSGVAHTVIALNNIEEGQHAVHFHETGDCSAEDFTSAGGHIAGGMQHGVLVEGGPHPGDLPNVAVRDDNVVNAEFFNARINVAEHLLDGDGSAFVVHAGPDDYLSQPSGDSGPRVACGVFQAAEPQPAAE